MLLKSMDSADFFSVPTFFKSIYVLGMNSRNSSRGSIVWHPALIATSQRNSADRYVD